MAGASEKGIFDGTALRAKEKKAAVPAASLAVLAFFDHLRANTVPIHRRKA